MRQQMKLLVLMKRTTRIQQNIDSYNTKISNATGGKCRATIGRYTENEIENISSFSGQKNNENKILLNPTNKGSYWLGLSNYGRRCMELL